MENEQTLQTILDEIEELKAVQKALNDQMAAMQETQKIINSRLNSLEAGRTALLNSLQAASKRFMSNRENDGKVLKFERNTDK